MVESMKNSLYFPSGASLRMKVDGKSAWHNAPEAESAPYSTTRTDEWVARSDGDRYGKEMLRTAPDTVGRWRTVYVGRQQWVFEHDLGAAPDAPVLGRLFLRSPVSRGMRWRVPLTDYLERAFVMPSRFGDMTPPMELVGNKETIDGHLCQQVRGIWNDRQVSFWLDPEYGWLPRQYAMHVDLSLLDYEAPDTIPGGVIPPLLAPRGMERLAEKPQVLDERLSGIVLERSGNFNYIARATLERTTTFAGGITHTDSLTIAVSDVKFGVEPDAGPFLTFSDVLRDGTRMEEHIGGRRFTPAFLNYYIWKQGEFLPTVAPEEAYWTRLWNDLRRLTVDFNLENLKRVDSKFLMTVCAIAALSINGAMAYIAHRNKKAIAP